jgi:hypothetical protein
VTVKILATDATIKTVSVTIQSLTVSGKQMTLAVFRQIPKAEIFDKEIEIIGTPWGIVNYSVANEGPRWIVVEKDGLLYRCVFPNSVFCGYESSQLNKAVELYKSCSYNSPLYYPPSKEKQEYIKGKFVTTHIYTSEEYKELETKAKQDYAEKERKARQDHEDRLKGYLEKINECRFNLQACERIKKKVENHIRILNSLDQLFIAV